CVCCWSCVPRRGSPGCSFPGTAHGPIRIGGLLGPAAPRCWGGGGRRGGPGGITPRRGGPPAGGPPRRGGGGGVCPPAPAARRGGDRQRLDNGRGHLLPGEL